MVHEALTELVDLSNELADLRGKPHAAPVSLPDPHDLPDELATVLASGALVFKLQGIDVNRIDEFTARARKRGFRRRIRIFGWHPKGHTWFGVPQNKTVEPRVLVIHRLEGLRTEELDIDEFVQLCIERTRSAIARARAAKVAKKEKAEAAAEAKATGSDNRDPVTGHVRKKVRHVKVVLPEAGGMAVWADGDEHAFSPEEHAYLVWSLEQLTLLSGDEAPDLSRWERRCLRRSGLDAVPTEGADLALYEKNWLDITTRDRTAPGSVSHQVAGYKVQTPGAWILDSNELAILRRAEKATPPRHKPSKAQKAIWKRFAKLMKADQIELRVR